LRADNSYRGLEVWQKSMDITVNVYNLVKRLPKEELYALSDQLRRAVVSIPSNIAEGQERHSDKDFARFLSIARGSKAEVETQLLICARVGYLTDADIELTMRELNELGKMLSAFIASLHMNDNRKPND